MPHSSKNYWDKSSCIVYRHGQGLNKILSEKCELHKDVQYDMLLQGS